MLQTVTVQYEQVHHPDCKTPGASFPCPGCNHAAAIDWERGERMANREDDRSFGEGRAYGEETR